MRHERETSEPPVPTEKRYGREDVVQIADRETLRSVLLDCGDPNSGRWMLIRSLVTCRAVLYGYDGQASVCLPTAALPIVSPDGSLITVEECSHLLARTDWMDGLLED